MKLRRALGRLTPMLLSMALTASCAAPIAVPEGPNAVPLIKADGSANLGV